MTKYSEIEIETAKNMLKKGYKWIARDSFGTLFTYGVKYMSGTGRCVCSCFVPIFESVKRDDKEPVSLETIVHPQILDDAEKNYLSAVIRPFRDRVQYIAKSFADDARYYRINCYIFIHFNDGSDDMDFPLFNESKMYKGMAINRPYTLKELGL